MKKFIEFLVAFIVAMASIIMFGAVFVFLLNHHKQGMWYSTFYVEYPAFLVGIMSLLYILSSKIEWRKFISVMIYAFMIGIALVDLMAYIFVINYTLDHTTVYSKLLYIGIICFVFYKAAEFFAKRDKAVIAAILIVIAVLLVPGGIIINESFGQYNAKQYVAVVTNKKEIKSSKSTSFYIYLEGADDKLPIKTYSAEDIYEYDEYSKGSVVIIKKYRGILGLPAIKMQKYFDIK